MLTDWALRAAIPLQAPRRRAGARRRAAVPFRPARRLVHTPGLTRDDALRRARVELGGLDQIKEEHRDARGIRLIDDLGRDLRYAFRQLRRAPGFAVLAMLCLGLGIGVNTAIFGVRQRGPVAAAARCGARPPRRDQPRRRAHRGRIPTYREFRARSRALSGLTTSLPMESDLEVHGDSEFVVAEVVPANYADVLGVTPALGRWFADDREPAAVISHAVWQRRFNAVPMSSASRFGSESQSYTIVGVAPREFTGVFAPMRTDLWVPIRIRPRGWRAQLEENALRAAC